MLLGYRPLSTNKRSYMYFLFNAINYYYYLYYLWFLLLNKVLKVISYFMKQDRKSRYVALVLIADKLSKCSQSFKPTALRLAKTLLSFGHSECNRVKNNKMQKHTISFCCLWYLIIWGHLKFVMSKPVSGFSDQWNCGSACTFARYR